MPTEPPSQERALVLAAEGQVLMLCNRMAESRARCDEALSLARAVGAEAVEAHVLNTLAANLSNTGEADAAVASAIEARAIARRLKLMEELGRSYVNGSDALNQAGRLEESIEIADEGIRWAGEVGVDRSWGDCLRVEVAERHLLRGHWDEAERLLDGVIDRGATGLNAVWAHGRLGYLRAERGDFVAASQALDQVDEQIRTSVGSMALAPWAATRVALELWTGRPDTAAAVAAECLEQVAVYEYPYFTARLYALAARACADLADRTPGDQLIAKEQAVRAQALLGRMDRLSSAVTGVTPPAVTAARAACAAEGARIGGPGDASVWAETRRLWEACENRYEAAYARWREAEALLAHRTDHVLAQTLMREAHAVAEELGARPLRERLESLARRARIELGTRAGGREIADELQRLELTPRELEVLALLTDGLTNREIAAQLFISDKTASVHVSRILGKLSVPNRAAAAALAQRLGVQRAEMPVAD